MKKLIPYTGNIFVNNLQLNYRLVDVSSMIYEHTSDANDVFEGLHYIPISTSRLILA